MTTFILACAALVLLSGLFYLLPRRLRRGLTDEDLQRANLEWYQLRQAELAGEGADNLREDARLRLLEDEPQRAGAPVPAAGTFPVWILLPLVALASSGLYYLLGAAPDVQIARQLEQLEDSSSEREVETLMRTIEARAARRPANLDYAALLGRYYMQREDYQRAAKTYAGLARETPQDAQALAYAAQADYLASGRQLSDQAKMLAEQALAVNPHQRTALGLLGMASFEQQQYRAAIQYWERLLVTETPGSDSARMIAGVIGAARQRLGEPAATAAVGSAAGSTAPGSTAAASTAAVSTAAPLTPGVTVRVSLPAGARVNAGDTVFVLARDAQSDSRMPIAVRRLQAGQLPLTLRLDDSNSMAGQKLSGANSVVVIVQVSPDGRPGEATATWLGRAGPLVPSLDEEALEILLQPRA